MSMNVKIKERSFYFDDVGAFYFNPEHKRQIGVVNNFALGTFGNLSIQIIEQSNLTITNPLNYPKSMSCFGVLSYVELFKELGFKNSDFLQMLVPVEKAYQIDYLIQKSTERYFFSLELSMYRVSFNNNKQYIKFDFNNQPLDEDKQLVVFGEINVGQFNFEPEPDYIQTGIKLSSVIFPILNPDYFIKGVYSKVSASNYPTCTVKSDFDISFPEFESIEKSKLVGIIHKIKIADFIYAHGAQVVDPVESSYSLSCFGLIKEVTLKKGSIQFLVNVTAQQFLELSPILRERLDDLCLSSIDFTVYKKDDDKIEKYSKYISPEDPFFKGYLRVVVLEKKSEIATLLLEFSTHKELGDRITLKHQNYRMMLNI